MTTTDLRKIGLKRGNDVSENLAPKFPSESRATSLTPLPLFPQEVPAELKLREDTDTGKRSFNISGCSR